MVRTFVSSVAVVVCLALAGCASQGRSAAGEARVVAADIDALTGAPWVGTLTYLDYTSGKQTTIDSSLMVQRVEGQTAWTFGIGYQKEPHADATEVVKLSSDGRMLGDETVISRQTLDAGGVVIVTQMRGEDNQRPATLRFEYRIEARRVSKRKVVEFGGSEAPFQRHVYVWER